MSKEDPRNSSVLYKILLPQEHAKIPDSAWSGTELDVSPFPLALSSTSPHSRFLADSLAQQKDGFLHLSTSEQLRATLDRFFGDQPEVVICAIQRDAVPFGAEHGRDLKFEDASVGTFGHIYGVSSREERRGRKGREER